MASKRKKPVASPKSSPLPLPPDALLAEIAAGIIVFDRAGQPVFVNSAAKRLLGWAVASADPYDLAAAERATLADLHNRGGQGAPPPPAATVPRPQPGEHTWLVGQADGSARAIAVLPVPLSDPTSGVAVGAVHTLQDVTAWYEQDATKEEFLSIASHELRAPLQPIMLASRTIQRWIDRPEHRADMATLADQIVAQSKRLSQLVLDMIDMTRINSGVFVIDPAPTDAAAILRTVVAEQHTVTQRDIDLSGADAPLPLAGEDEKLWQAFTNLISNAIKYSPAPAPVTVTADRFTEADGAPWLRVAVRDLGIGIAPDQVAHVFDRFYRATVTKGMERQQQDGLGLGLYITRAIVVGHGGRIHATSAVGEGSAFTIELPLRQSDGAGADDAAD